MQYGALLSRAWNIVWRNKIIWVFGFLAALGSGGGGGNFNYRGSGRDFNFPSPGQPGAGNLPPEVESFLTRLFTDQTLLITLAIAIVCIGLLIGLVVAFISALGHGGMVEMVREVDETEATRFGTGWTTGLRRMLPVFLIRFLLGLPTFIVVMAGVIPFLLSFVPLIARNGLPDSPDWFFAGGIATSVFLCFLPALCIGLLITIPLSVLETLAIRALVLEDLGIWGSLRRGWAIFTGNLGQVAVVWLIFLLIGIGIGIVIGLPVAAVAIVAILPLALMTATSPLFAIPLILVIILIALLSAALRSIVEAFTSAVWTLAYRQWTARSVPVVTTG
jgi:hypothetical protein